MTKKEKLKLQIEKYGIEDVSKFIGEPMYKLLKYCDYPVETIDIIHEILNEYFREINYLPGGYMTYNEFTLSYNSFEGTILWNNGFYVENNGGGVSFEFYATPFWDGLSIIPINVSDVWIENMDSGEPMSIFDEIDEGSYYENIDIDYKKLNTVDKVFEWFETEYKPQTYDKIKELIEQIRKDNDI